MSDFIDIKKLKQIAINKYFIDEESFNELIIFLLKEKFVITDLEYNQIYNIDSNYNRQNAYFFMVCDQNKNLTNHKDKNILILGLGGIGANVAEQLTRSGFENFTIIDNDKVENSNLIRQNAYYLEDVSLYKIDALEKRLKLINQNVKIDKYNFEICKEKSIDKYIQKANFVVSTVDKPYRKIRKIINNVCLKYNKPVLFSGFAEHVGMIGPFIIPHKTACLECIDNLLIEEPLKNVKIVPSFGPMCSIISSIVTEEIINYFIKYNKKNLIGCTLMFNMLNYKTKIYKWNKNSLCRKCGDKNDSK